MLILDIQRMSTEDGPGLRTTVFCKGCTLKCAWCHNPESISPKTEFIWLETRCIGCGTCIKVCPQGALSAGRDGIVRDNTKCISCGTAADCCPAEAIERKGTEMKPADLVGELMKDKAYFGADGGVTLSGGETLAQSDEAAEVLRLLKERGINTAVDTCGFVPWNVLEKVIPYTDLFLYDIKLFDSAEHEKWTGAPNERILENFVKLCKSVGREKIWVRTPVIPGATDSEENIRNIAEFVNGKTVRYELCAFNNLCRDKYRRMGIDWIFKTEDLMTREQMEKLHGTAYEKCRESIWTGAVAVEKEGGN